MACLIKRNGEKIVSVKTPSGVESKLFRSIHSIPFLAGTDTSLEIYKNMYSDKVQKAFEGATENVFDTGEPMLYIIGKDSVYDNIEDAIIANESGTLQAAFKNPKTGEMMPVTNFRVDGNERGEFIYSVIQQGFLSPNRVLDENGDTYFEGKGIHHTDKSMGAHATKFDAYMKGNARVTITTDGKVTIPNTDNTVIVEGQDGSIKHIRTEDVLEEVRNNNPKNKVEILFEYFSTVEKVIPDFANETVEEVQETADIQEALMDFLSLMGFTTSTIESYRERYNNAHGKDPDVQALADMANKIVAFREGKIGVEDLSEEVAHIAIEFYADQNSIASALAVVHLTEEYAEYSDYYRNKYKKQHPNDNVALEEAVRREILGKILKAELVDRFSKEGKTAERQTLIDRLREMWSEFVGFLGNSINNRHVKEIKRINDQIADSILGGKIGNFDTSIESSNVYYSALPTDNKIVSNKLQAAKAQLEGLFRKEYKSPIPNKQALERISQDMETINVISSANAIAGHVYQQAKVLVASLRDVQKNDTAVSREDLSRITYLETAIKTAESIYEDLKKLENVDAKGKEAIEKVGSAIAEASANFSSVDNIVAEASKRNAKKLEDRILEETDLTEEQKATEKTLSESSKTDITLFGRLFGLISTSKNPHLRQIAQLGKNMRTMVNIGYLNVAQPFLAKFFDSNLQSVEKTIIKRANGKATYYYKGPRDEHAFREDEKAEKVRIILELLPELTEEQVTARLKKETAYSILKEDKLQTEYSRQIKEWQLEWSEKPKNALYEADKKERYANAYVSQVTEEVIANKNAAKGKRDQKYRGADGRVDSSKKSSADKILDQEEKNNYRSIVSPIINGEVRKDLRVIDTAELTVEERERLSEVLPFTIDSEYRGEIVVPAGALENKGDYETLADLLEEDSRVSLDLNTLNMRYRQELKDGDKKGGFSGDFFERLREAQNSGEDAYEWAVQNGSLTLTSEYYEKLSGQEFTGYIDAAQNMLDEMLDTPEKAELETRLREMRDLMSEKNRISKLYRKEGNPMEVDPSMPESVRTKYKQIESELESKKLALSVPSSYFAEGTSDLSERVLTQDFYDGVITSGLSEFEYAKKHMTGKNIGAVEDFAYSVNAYMKNYQSTVKKKYDVFIRKVQSEIGFDGLSIEETVELLKNEYAKSKVLGYYQRFEPKGATAFLESLRGEFGKEVGSNGKTNLENFLSRDAEFLESNPVAGFIEITPDYSWSEDISNDKYRNERYMEGEFYKQPKLVKDGKPTKYVDTEFFEEFGIDMEKWLNKPTLDLSKMEATKNLKEYEYLKMVIELKEKTLETYGETQSVSKFQRSQLTSTNAEKIVAAGTGKVGQTRSNLLDAWRGVFQDRIDEKVHGETIDAFAEGGQINIRTIPTYYLDLVEDPEMLSENTLQAELLMYKQALLYEARTQNEADMNSILRRIENDNIGKLGVGGKITNITRGGQVSNLYQKAHEYLGNELYGIKQTRKMQGNIMGRDINFTKVINVIQSFTRFGNLAFNPAVDITSFTTGLTVNLTDRFAEDFYHRSAYDRAFLTIPKVMQYVSESGKLKKESELNHIFELFGTETIDERLENSAQGRVVKLASRSPFGLSKLSNMGIKPQIVYSTLMDSRFIDGKFQGWQQYYNSQKAKDKTKDKKVIEAEFKAASKESFYDHLVFTKDGVDFNDTFKERFEDPTAEFNKQVRKMSSKVESIIQITDTVISETDRTAAQRDVLTNITMMHKGWFPVQLTKRFKAEHINYSTGAMEQGHYVGVAKLIAEMVKTRDPRQVAKMLAELPFHQRANLKRVGADSALLIALIMLSQFIFAADDDDDSYLEDLMQYSFLRMSKEFHSSTLTGMGKSTIGVLKSPITAINTLENLEPFTLLTSAGSLVKGDTDPMWKTIKSLTVAKRWGQIIDVQDQTDTYWYFNNPEIPFSHPIKKERQRIAAEKKELKESRLAEREAAASVR